MDDLTQRVDDIESRLDDNDQSLSDFSDSLDSTLGDQSNTNDDIEQRLETVENDSGQLAFPLTQDTIDLIKEQFPGNFATLSSGLAVVIDPRVSSTSNIFLTVAQKSSKVTAGSFLVGGMYQIDTTGSTNFTSIGATNSNPFTIFIATGVGSGTGKAYPIGNLSYTANAGDFTISSTAQDDTSVVSYLILN